MIKNSIVILFFIVLASPLLRAQTDFNVYNDGMEDLVLESGLTATIFGGYVSQTNIVDGRLDNQSTIQLTGNWANNNAGGTNVFLTTTGVVNLIGTTEQTIRGTVTTSFYDLEVNNTAASGGVTVTTIIDVANTLTLTDGVVTTSSSSPLVMNAGSTSGSGSAGSYIDGPMRKVGTTAFTFPLGDGGVWARLAIGTPSSSTTFEAQYVRASYINTNSLSSLPTPALNNVSTKEYWNLTRVAGTGNATVRIFWGNAVTSDITDCADLKLARWNGGGWENSYNTSGSGNCLGAGSISSSAAVTSFVGPFTFGSLLPAAVNPLPIELLSFNANLNKDVVNLVWSTASELNNDYFTIEKSQSGSEFVMVDVVSGSGTSNVVKDYSFTDKYPYTGLSYYRIKQTDFDGQFKYSDLESIRYDREGEFSIFPNPINDNTFYINMNGVQGQKLKIALYNSMGRLVYAKPITQQDGQMTVTINLTNQLSPGLYLVTGSGGNQELFRQKLIIK